MFHLAIKFMVKNKLFLVMRILEIITLMKKNIKN